MNLAFLLLSPKCEMNSKQAILHNAIGPAEIGISRVLPFVECGQLWTSVKTGLMLRFSKGEETE